MADLSNTACKECRVPLRLWVRKHLDEETYRKFEWIKIEAEPEAEFFKIPWVEQDKPGYEDLLVICKAWAENKDGQESKQSPSKLKSRLRDALRNTYCFKKRKELSRMGQQTGDYLVYQYLSREEEKEEKDERKQKSLSGSSTPSVSNFQESDVSHSQPNDCKDDEELMNMNNLSYALPAHAINGDFGMENLANPTVCQNYSLDPSLLEFDPFGADPSANVSMEEALGVSDQFNLENALTDPSEPMPQMPTQSFDVTANVANVSMELNLKTLLDIYQVPIDDNLMKCNVILKYDDVIVQSFVVDFSNQVWFLPENAQPFANAAANNVYFLPRRSNEVTDVKTILDRSEEGFVLKIVPQYQNQVLQDLCLYGLRKCDSHVYFLNSQNGTSKMKKNEEICIFSYMGYICDSYEYNSNPRNSQPKCEVLLVVGTKPSATSSRTRVSLTIEPVNADSLEKKFGGSDSNMSLRFSSDPNSFGDALEQLCSNIEANRPPVSFEEMILS